MATNTLLLSPTPFIRGHRNSLIFPTSSNLFSSQQYGHHGYHLKLCKAASSSSSSSSSSSTSASTSGSLITDFDLYDLLGIDSSSDQTEIKKAYRSLQKKCHPDIAGPAGHDMAIILNQVYALLSDPVSRFAYDIEQAKTVELRGYTGKPLYSAWLGPATEERAVFVDEVKCVGCLKCALLADKTFAIESVYGRARVVGQWADPEHKIQQSIDACPVSCISMVERSDLAALEFLMSKQPRGNVKIGASNTGGTRVFDVFSEVKVLHKRLEESRNRKSYRDSKYSEVQSDARMSAIQAIRSISNWLYWTSPVSDTSSNITLKGVTRSFEPDIEKLRDAAAAVRRHATLKTGEKTELLPQTTLKDEYWVPSAPVLPLETKAESNDRNTTQAPSFEDGENVYDKTFVKKEAYRRRPLISGISLGLAVVAASVIRLQIAGEAVGGLDEHIGGSFALQVVNSSWSQVILAGVTWYLIGMVVIQLVEGLTSRSKF